MQVIVLSSSDRYESSHVMLTTINVVHIQALVCSADLSLEHPSFIGEDEWGGPSGWGHTHQCKDWDAINRVVANNGVTQAALLANADWLESA